ncbi:MAG: hypothetical protein HY720_17610 [Planctomycetes bacterium]|nr:hypothetical protein [Planctomycetota bacterium]
MDLDIDLDFDLFSFVDQDQVQVQDQDQVQVQDQVEEQQRRRVVERRGEPSQDPREAIEVELHPLGLIGGMIAEGRITHALAIVSLQRVLLARAQPRR